MCLQEETVETISSMIHVVENSDCAMLFVKGFFSFLARQWDRISHYRTDKFLMFIRRFLRQTLIYLRDREWAAAPVEAFANELFEALQILPLSLTTHLCDVYNEELAKVSG